MLRNFTILFLIACSFSLSVSAEINIIERELVEAVSKNQSQEQVEAFALQKAKRLALEEAGTFLSSLKIVKDNQLSKDEIITLSSGVLQSEIVGEPEITVKNKTVYVHVKTRIRVDTDILTKQIEAVLKNKPLMEKLEEELIKNKNLEEQLANVKSADNEVLDSLKQQIISLEEEKKKWIKNAGVQPVPTTETYDGIFWHATAIGLASISGLLTLNAYQQYQSLMSENENLENEFNSATTYVARQNKQKKYEENETQIERYQQEVLMFGLSTIVAIGWEIYLLKSTQTKLFGSSINNIEQRNDIRFAILPDQVGRGLRFEFQSKW